ncbi:hypothetical protein [Hydrogenimonas sp.]
MNEALRQLKDIKPPVEVPDHSLLLLLLLLAALLVAVVAALLWFARKDAAPRRRRRADPKAVAKAKLASIDFTDTKDAVYTFDEYLPRLIAADAEAMREFEALQSELERYKYRKRVPPLEGEVIERMRRLIRKGTG